MKILKQAGLMLMAFAVLLVTPALARVEKHLVHGAALEGNLEGNSADRIVYVILPDSYEKAKKRRYSVIIFLHGFNSTAEQYVGRVPFETAMRAAGSEFIVVVPDSMTKWGGSMYSNSPTSGNFEDFLANDLVGWIDKSYRTHANRDARGLVGHSMGGYGALKLGMKRPDVFGSLYAMNPCCQIPRPASAAEARFESMTVEQALAAEWMVRGNFAVASAWSPNPGNPPFYSDQGSKNGQPVPSVIASWAANAPLAMVPQYLPALRKMRGIAVDTGDTDFVRADDEAIHEALLKFGIVHDWELYVGDHGNKMPERFGTKVLPFFTKHLQKAAR